MGTYFECRSLLTFSLLSHKPTREAERIHLGAKEDGAFVPRSSARKPWRKSRAGYERQRASIFLVNSGLLLRRSGWTVDQAHDQFQSSEKCTGGRLR